MKHSDIKEIFLQEILGAPALLPTGTHIGYIEKYSLN